MPPAVRMISTWGVSWSSQIDLLDVRVHARPSGWISTATAVRNTRTRIHASLHFIRPFSRGFVQELMVIRLMTKRAFLRAKPMIILSFFALQ
ncbi:hypothetical protein GIB67_002748 [Kingdonia uniflora]|uniref:Uncharacterized protein n=1 Tax=Kingdonia uniflora TaxID=39325 RepID=A0A7J7P818_9MAGN|nr:hypothetical protein GIB67_002748 [Kingdonia uniflora]